MLRIDKPQNNVIRGLSLFIGDVRNCSSKEQEEKVVQKEMAKVRQKFLKGGLSAYDRKKYIWKLIYAHILGFDVDFGHDVAVSLINCVKFSDKVTGYIAIGIMLNESADSNLFSNCIETIKSDLTCGHDVREALALGTLGNIGSPGLAKDLGICVISKALADNRSVPIYVRKKACLCLLSFLRRYKQLYNKDKWIEGLSNLLKCTNYGLLLSAMSLFKGTIKIVGPEGYEVLIPQLVNILQNMKEYASDYYYYMTPCPWLQVKIFQILQFFPPPVYDRLLLKEINQQISNVYRFVTVTKHVNKNNSDHSILFEAMKLTLRYEDCADTETRHDTVKLLAKFIAVKEPNIRYLAFELLSRLKPIHMRTEPNLMKDNLETFLSALKEKDISIRKTALDTIFTLCNAEVASDVVNELLDHLQANDYELMEEMVLKVAILAEKFAINLSWYIDVIIKLIEFAGDYVDEDLWFRVAQMVTGFGDAAQSGDEKLQKYAALKMFDVMRTKSLHEAMIKIGAYVLSEFGFLISQESGKSTTQQLALIEQKLVDCSPQGKAILLTALMKLTRHSEEIRPSVKRIFEAHKDHWDIEIQQRACEYLIMLDFQDKSKGTSAESDASSFIKGALEKMPNFSEEIQTNNVLTKRILALKVKDGFHINMQEAEQQLKETMKQTFAIQNPVMMPQEPLYEESKQQSMPMDLLGFGQPALVTSVQQEINDLLGSSVSTVKLQFQDKHPECFAPNQTVALSANTLSINGAQNGQQWKALLPFVSKEGALYKDDEIEITAQAQCLKYLVRIMLSFKGQQSNPTNIDVAISNTNELGTMEIVCSPVKFTTGQPPQVIVMAMLKESNLVCPMLKINVGSLLSTKSINVRLPIYVNKVIESVDQMTEQAFKKNWDDISFNRPNTFLKIDAILKNPAPAGVAVSNVLTQIANFMQASLNLKVLPKSESDGRMRVRAAGQACFKPSTQQGFPQNPATMAAPNVVPVMIEAEFYPEDTSSFRLSIRAAPSNSLVPAIVNLLKLFMYPNE